MDSVPTQDDPLDSADDEVMESQKQLAKMIQLLDEAAGKLDDKDMELDQAKLESKTLFDCLPAARLRTERFEDDLGVNNATHACSQVKQLAEKLQTSVNNVVRENTSHLQYTQTLKDIVDPVFDIIDEQDGKKFSVKPGSTLEDSITLIEGMVKMLSLELDKKNELIREKDSLIRSLVVSMSQVQPINEDSLYNSTTRENALAMWQAEVDDDYVRKEEQERLAFFTTLSAKVKDQFPQATPDLIVADQQLQKNPSHDNLTSSVFEIILKAYTEAGNIANQQFQGDVEAKRKDFMHNVVDLLKRYYPGESQELDSRRNEFDANPNLDYLQETVIKSITYVYQAETAKQNQFLASYREAIKHVAENALFVRKSCNEQGVHVGKTDIGEIIQQQKDNVDALSIDQLTNLQKMTNKVTSTYLTLLKASCAQSRKVLKRVIPTSPIYHTHWKFVGLMGYAFQNLTQKLAHQSTFWLQISKHLLPGYVLMLQLYPYDIYPHPFDGNDSMFLAAEMTLAEFNDNRRLRENIRSDGTLIMEEFNPEDFESTYALFVSLLNFSWARDKDAIVFKDAFDSFKRFMWKTVNTGVGAGELATIQTEELNRRLDDLRGVYVHLNEDVAPEALARFLYEQTVNADSTFYYSMTSILPQIQTQAGVEFANENLNVDDNQDDDGDFVLNWTSMIDEDDLNMVQAYWNYINHFWTTIADANQVIDKQTNRLGDPKTLYEKLRKSARVMLHPDKQAQGDVVGDISAQEFATNEFKLVDYFDQKLNNIMQTMAETVRYCSLNKDQSTPYIPGTKQLVSAFLKDWRKHLTYEDMQNGTVGGYFFMIAGYYEPYETDKEHSFNNRDEMFKYVLENMGDSYVVRELGGEQKLRMAFDQAVQKVPIQMNNVPKDVMNRLFEDIGVMTLPNRMDGTMLAQKLGSLYMQISGQTNELTEGQNNLLNGITESLTPQDVGVRDADGFLYLPVEDLNAIMNTRVLPEMLAIKGPFKTPVSPVKKPSREKSKRDVKTHESGLPARAREAARRQSAKKRDEKLQKNRRTNNL